MAEVGIEPQPLAPESETLPLGNRTPRTVFVQLQALHYLSSKQQKGFSAEEIRCVFDDI